MDTARAREQRRSFGPNKEMRMKSPKKKGRGNLVYNRSENFDTYAGLLNNPPPPPPSRAMSFSYVHVQQQPPLLPLPHKAKKRSGTQSILIVASENRWGPDPKHLPKVVLGMGNTHHDVVSTAVFNLAPPPSSLPLPKFSLRSKLGCNAEAAAGAGVDDGATNNLRRLLRLR